jgi:hypothetical protein
MPDAYVIEVFGRTAGIVARDSQSNSFNFFSAAPRFNAIEGQRFSDPLAAERGARVLAQYGSLRGAAKRNIPAQTLAGVVSVSYTRPGGLNAALRIRSFAKKLMQTPALRECAASYYFGPGQNAPESLRAALPRLSDCPIWLLP